MTTPHAALVRRLFEIGGIRFGEFTLFDVAEADGLAAPAVVGESHEFLRTARFA